MPQLSSLRVDGKLRCLVFGYYKSGKTAGALTFPRPNVLDFDRGVAVALAPWWREKFKISPDAIQFEHFASDPTDARGVPTAHKAYDAACRYFDESMKPGNVDTFDTWVVDSCTTLGEMARNKGIVLLGGNQLSSKPLSHTHQQAKSTGIIHMKMQDYGAERSLVEQFIDMVLSTDKHVVVIAHAKDEYEGSGDDAKVVGVIPLVTGQSAQRIPLKFNEVYWIELAKEGTATHSYVRTSADSRIKRGSRYGLTDRTHWDFKSVTDDLAKQGFTFSPGTVVPTTAAAAAGVK